MADDVATALFDRTGLPDDLKALLNAYPRETWDKAPTIGATGRFWLKRHAMFRDLGAALVDGLKQLQEGQIAAQPFAQWFVPRLNFFLGELEGHHAIEDQHYFPVFLAAEPNLGRGFKILDWDHHVIHDLLAANAESANLFLRALGGGGDPLKRAAEAHGANATRLLGGLLRHLEDEEDLIVPLLIDRGEDALGLA